MMRRLTKHAVPGPKNSLCYWTSYVNPLRVYFNFAVITLCRIMPSLRLKNALYRMVGVKVGKNARIGLLAMLDPFFPHLITVGDNSIIGYNVTILAHEFMVDYWATGPVVVGPHAMVGANSTVLAGVHIGDGAVISALSLVNRDVEPHTMAGGIPVRPLRGEGAASKEDTWDNSMPRRLQSK